MTALSNYLIPGKSKYTISGWMPKMLLRNAGIHISKKCKKYIEGIVKICPYCGQYLKK